MYDTTGAHSAPETRPPFVARARKFLVGAVGMAATLTTCEALHGTEVGTWLSVAVAVATAAGVYRVPNAQPSA